ncbi:MgtC/SapB family protein [Clostridium sp. Marseille-P299]|uniref:MgtC/SapB family protein n=1 Tax=Clostridium sp. Marseille-P299 TaxID=1805477 RepID=UPI0008342393|nr:MgtC/SapB family protein [Clostridium sp. Marseille-P299]
MNLDLDLSHICIRLLIATILGGIIGWEREFKSRPAGLRTHILVCVGATIIAIIQQEIMFDSLKLGMEYPELSGIIRSDPARLICQVVSGIGFLGAGTIVFTKNSIHGLTTAASLWSTAALGLATGMGYYHVALVGIVIIFFALTMVKKIQSLPASMMPTMRRIEIVYCNRETKEFIQKYFEEHHIRVRNSNFSVQVEQDVRTYTDDYTIELPKGMTYVDVAEGLAEQKTITHIHLLNI